jgi:hypothetical protein
MARQAHSVAINCGTAAGVPGELGYRLCPTMRGTPFSVSGQVAQASDPAAQTTLMGRIMLNLGRIEQRNQHIHVEQESRQGNSSRSWFTNSGVTAAEPGLTHSSGTPLRKSRRDFAGCKACRVSAEAASPTLLC